MQVDIRYTHVIIQVTQMFWVFHLLALLIFFPALLLTVSLHLSTAPSIESYNHTGVAYGQIK